MTLEEEAPERHCEIVHTIYGPYRNCDRQQLRYRMNAAEEEEQEGLLEHKIATEMLYDVVVSVLQRPRLQQARAIGRPRPRRSIVRGLRGGGVHGT